MDEERRLTERCTLNLSSRRKLGQDQLASFANVTEQVGLIKVTDSELALIVNEEVLSNSNEKDAKKKTYHLP